MISSLGDNMLKRSVNVKRVSVNTKAGEKLRQTFERGPLARTRIRYPNSAMTDFDFEPTSSHYSFSQATPSLEL